MAWDFETEPEFQEKLDWIESFMKAEIEPLSNLGMAAYGPKARERLIRPLQQQVKDQGLWACHLGPELGGQGFGQVKLGLMNEKLGRNSLAPTIFGCQAPDTGNAEIIAHYGTEAQKDQWLKPLLNGDIRSAYSMSEPSGGSDPLTFRTTAVLEGDEWVINGERVVLHQRQVVDHPDRLCGDRPGRQGPLSAHVHVHRAHQDAGGEHPAQRRGRRRRRLGRLRPV